MRYTLPAEPTIADCYRPAVELAMSGDQAEALRWFDGVVGWTTNHLPEPARYPSREAVEALVRSNIGYFAGYYGEAERRAVYEIYGAVHPVFGGDFTPTPEKALEAGRRAALGEFSE